jgi:hypothetical protein
LNYPQGPRVLHSGAAEAAVMAALEQQRVQCERELTELHAARQRELDQLMTTRAQRLNELNQRFVLVVPL